MPSPDPHADCPHCALKDEIIADLQQRLAGQAEANAEVAIKDLFATTAAPSQIIYALYQARGRFMTREALDLVVPLKHGHVRDLKTIDVLVWKARKAAEKITHEEIIETVWSQGYRITPHGIWLVDQAIGAEPGKPVKVEGLTPRTEHISRQAGPRKAKPEPAPVTMASIRDRVRGSR